MKRPYRWTKKELWAKLDAYPEHLFSNRGRIKRWKNDSVLKGYADKHEYLVTRIGVKLEKFHRLIALAFVANPHNHPLVCHKNDIPDDNRACNLYWGTPLMNAHDRDKRHNYKRLAYCGEKHRDARLKEKQVKLIRMMYFTFRWSIKKIYKLITSKWGIKEAHTRNIIRRRTWKHI